MTETKCIVRYARVTPRKAGQVIDLISGKKVDAALRTLKFTNKTAVPIIIKAINSAVSNFGRSIDTKTIIIKEAYVGPGPSMSRMRPAAMGRGTTYKRKTAHITIILKKLS
ncbi:MAG: 50S ribosomal protein L22 [Elusimicrobiota bacterium]